MLSRNYTPLRDSAEVGAFVILEGPSAIGKSTLAVEVAQRLGGASIHTVPDPHVAWCATVNRELRALPQFGFYLSGLLHSADLIRRHRRIGPVVADRYVSSVVACHAAVNRVSLRQVQQLMQPFAEYLETPDATFYLRCSLSTLAERMQAKLHSNAATADDVALFSKPGRLVDVMAGFEELASEDPTAVILDTDDRTPQQIADRIVSHLKAQGAAD
ncbi:dTMP kinase [Uniformispora flossi]|uniref:dTMP kinase n=1 Tax=Uniformispora flossi TaxID=3390723 RepID=UPI003C2BD5A8